MLCIFASQSSSWSVTKYRGIMNSRTGSLSLFFEAALRHCWDHTGNREGLASSVLRHQSGGTKAWASHLLPKKCPKLPFRIKEKQDLIAPHSKRRHVWRPAWPSSRLTSVAKLRKQQIKPSPISYLIGTQKSTSFALTSSKYSLNKWTIVYLFFALIRKS